MTTATITEAKENLLAFVKLAETEEVVLMNEGKPVGVITGFADDNDYQEHELLNDDRFQKIIAESRQQFKEEKFTRIEDLE